MILSTRVPSESDRSQWNRIYQPNLVVSNSNRDKTVTNPAQTVSIHRYFDHHPWISKHFDSWRRLLSPNWADRIAAGSKRFTSDVLSSRATHPCSSITSRRDLVKVWIASWVLFWACVASVCTSFGGVVVGARGIWIHEQKDLFKLINAHISNI